LVLDISPITWRWTITVPRTEHRAEGTLTAAAEIQRALQAEGATCAAPDLGTVNFKCPGITGMTRWALLAPISSGVVRISDSPGEMRISYALRFTLVFWSSVAAALVFWLLQNMPGPTVESTYPFLWLFGGNVAISMWRFPNFLRGTVSNVSPPNNRIERPRER
jgi:hypothetical protein